MGFVPLNPSSSPPPMRGFVPLSAKPEMGFTPIEQPVAGSGLSDEIAPAVKTMHAISQVYPVAETAANLITQGAALPIAGIAGLGAAATKAAGLTEAEPADVVHSVAGALTYQPATDLGKHLTQATMVPFEKLAEAGQWAGGKTLDATGSPLAATAVDTAVNALPMLLGPMKKGAQGLREHIAGKVEAEPVSIPSVDPVASAPEVQRGFIPLKEVENAGAIETVPRRILSLETDARTLPEPNGQRLEMVRGARDNGVPAMAEQFSDVPSGRGTEAIRKSVDLPGTTGRERELRAEERSLGNNSAPDGTPAMLSPDSVRGSDTFATGSIESVRRSERDFEDALSQEARPIEQGTFAGKTTANQETGFVQRRNADSSGVGETFEAGSGNTTHAPSARDVPRPGIASGRLTQTGFVPLRESIDAAAHEAATSPHNAIPEPTRAQIDAGNYKKGAINLHGLDIAVENPKGSIRSGVSPEGKPWQTEMQQHYGYVKRTLGKDGDPVDVFIGNKPESQRVFVVDQVNPKTGRFDEHKAILGADTLAEAKAMYQANYQPGWKGLGAITPMDMGTFKEWVKNGDTKKAIAQQGIPDVGGETVRNSFAPGANYAPLVDDSRAAAGT